MFVLGNFRDKCPRDFWKLWNFEIWKLIFEKLSKMHSGNLFQVVLSNMWLVVLINCVFILDGGFSSLSSLEAKPNV